MTVVIAPFDEGPDADLAFEAREQEEIEKQLNVFKAAETLNEMVEMSDVEFRKVLGDVFRVPRKVQNMLVRRIRHRKEPSFLHHILFDNTEEEAKERK